MTPEEQSDQEAKERMLSTHRWHLYEMGFGGFVLGFLMALLLTCCNSRAQMPPIPPAHAGAALTQVRTAPNQARVLASPPMPPKNSPEYPLASKIAKRDGTNFLGVYMGMIAEWDGWTNEFNFQGARKPGPPFQGVMMFSATSGELLRWISYDEFDKVYVKKTVREYHYGEVPKTNAPARTNHQSRVMLPPNSRKTRLVALSPRVRALRFSSAFSVQQTLPEITSFNISPVAPVSDFNSTTVSGTWNMSKAYCWTMRLDYWAMNGRYAVEGSNVLDGGRKVQDGVQGMEFTQVNGLLTNSIAGSNSVVMAIVPAPVWYFRLRKQ